jgi:hypothetical protein
MKSWLVVLLSCAFALTLAGWERLSKAADGVASAKAEAVHHPLRAQDDQHFIL